MDGGLAGSQFGSRFIYIGIHSAGGSGVDSGACPGKSGGLRAYSRAYLETCSTAQEQLCTEPGSDFECKLRSWQVTRVPSAYFRGSQWPKIQHCALKECIVSSV